MSPKAVKHSAKEEAVMKQLIHQLGPKTRLAKLTMANWKAEKAARLVKPSAGSDSGIVNIPLEQLEDTRSSCASRWTRTSWRNWCAASGTMGY